MDGKSDVLRVAEALGATTLRYRNFSNEAVRRDPPPRPAPDEAPSPPDAAPVAAPPPTAMAPPAAMQAPVPPSGPASMPHPAQGSAQWLSLIHI